MHTVSKIRAVLGCVPRALARSEARAFLKKTADCQATQQNVLQSLLHLNRMTDFSQDHGIDGIRTVEELRKRVPIAQYEYYEKYIERMKKGQFSALLGPENHLLMFALSSGTTSNSKYVPITKQFLEDYRYGWQVWGIHTLDDNPGVNCRKIVQLSSDYDRFRTEAGTPCGNISGLVAKVQKRIVKTMYTVPGTVAKISNQDAKNYCTLKLAIGDDNVGMVMTANPSTLIQLAKLGDQNKEKLIRDIADGTLECRKDVPAEVLRRLRFRLLRKNKRRAKQLEQIVEQTGHLFPRDYWDGLHVAAVWSGGSAGAYVSSLKDYFGNVVIRDHGLSASEGRMTIPIYTEESTGILDIKSHFFEFIPEKDYEKDQPETLLAHELEEGKNYYILLTTSSGFFRYDICDVVKCTGFYGTTPMLEFLHKGTHISNLTGEKISESQVVMAVRQCTERMGLKLRHYSISPEWGDPPHYQLLIEKDEIYSSEMSNTLAENIDRQLQEINCEYQEKRKSGRLDPLCVNTIPNGTWDALANSRQGSIGGCQEQYKHPCLVPDVKFTEKLLKCNETVHHPAAIKHPVKRGLTGASTKNAG